MIIILWDNNQIYSNVGLLPIGFLLVYLLSLPFCNIDIFNNIGYKLFWGLSLTKCVIAPLILCLGNYTSQFTSLNSDYINWAVFLMIYEQIACTLVIIRTYSSNVKIQRYSLRGEKHSSKAGFNKFALLFALIILILWLFIPSIRNNFVSIFDMMTSNQMFTGSDYTSMNAVGTSGRTFTTLFLVLFKSFRIIFPFYLITILKERFNNSFSFIISIFIVLLQFMFISETVAMSFVVSFILLSYMYRIYQNYQKTIIVMMAISSLFVVFVLSIIFDSASTWYGVNNVTEYMSQILQAYVPGVCNTASVFRVIEINPMSVLWDTLKSTIPFQNSIFGAASWSNDINTLFMGTQGLESQICSTIGGGWYIFGFLGAPLFSALFTRVSMINGYKFALVQNERQKVFYLFMCVQTILGIGVYNIQTTITLWIQVGIILYLGTRLAK